MNTDSSFLTKATWLGFPTYWTLNDRDATEDKQEPSKDFEMILLKIYVKWSFVKIQMAEKP